MSTTVQSDQPPPYQGSKVGNHLNVPMTDEARLSMEDEERDLPEGWIRQFDSTSGHHFYVDELAKPPRSIWVHPYEDPEWQKAHSTRDNTSQTKAKVDAPSHQQGSSSGSGPSKTEGGERGFFGKIKDKTLGTKEEREAAKKQRAAMEQEMQRRYLERRQLLMQQQQAARQAQAQQLLRNYQMGGHRYAAPPMAYGRQRRGGMGMGMPLAGGLAGGLLLGSMLDNDYGGGGDFGGGDFGGGDF